MRRAIPIAVVCFVLVVPLSLALAQGEDDPLFRAMQDELKRSTEGLSIESMPPPYYVSYRIHDVESITVRARYGSLVQTEDNERSYLYIDCRVGDPAFDNSGFVGSWQDIYNVRSDLVEEDDYDVLRHQIWLRTDAAYKSALENLARKDAYRQSHPTKEEIPDFAPAEAFVAIGEPVRLDTEPAAWEPDVRAVAQALQEFPSLQDWQVTLTAVAENERYVNSEGSRHLKGAVYTMIEVAATAQSEDGQRLTSFLRHVARGDDEPPTGSALVGEVREMAAELEAVLAAPTIDEYVGPVLFDGFASAQFMSQLFAGQLAPAKLPLVAQDWMKQYLPDPKLAGRLNRRVFPEFVTITDEPSVDVWEDVRLVGHQTVDDEGVPCQDITLVEDGRLVALPMCRQPTKKIGASNGHARTFENQWTASTVTNVFVRTEKSKKDLVKELRSLARDFDNEYGLLITRLDEPSVSNHYRWTEVSEDSRPLLTAPIAVYKVDVKDGTLEPVRGLVFDELSIRTLRDVAALGRDTRAWNVLQPMGIEGVTYPATIVTPSVLVEEMELTSGTAQEPLPLSGRPLAGM